MQVTPMTSLLPPPPAEALLSSPNAKVSATRTNVRGGTCKR